MTSADPGLFAHNNVACQLVSKKLLNHLMDGKHQTQIVRPRPRATINLIPLSPARALFIVPPPWLVRKDRLKKKKPPPPPPPPPRLATHGSSVFVFFAFRFYPVHVRRQSAFPYLARRSHLLPSSVIDPVRCFISIARWFST